jgi:dTDP-4-dehydrorhamnose reductase
VTSWLITGATGLLGGNAAEQLSSNHDVTGVSRTVPTSVPVPFVGADISTAIGRDGLIDRTQPSVVLHSAAISSIEECAADPELAWEVNVAASADLAAQAARAQAAFVYISTDAVFDGSKGGYTERDEPTPNTDYGRTKLAGERAVLEANPDALVARVNFYGWSPTGRRSLAEFFHTRLARGERVNGFTDTVVSTLYVGDLVNSIEQLVAARASGIVNVVSSEPTSKFDYGRALAAGFGFDPELVQPALSTDFLSVKRGSRLDLDTSKIFGLLGQAPANQQQGIDHLVADYVAGRPAAVGAYNTQKEA